MKIIIEVCVDPGPCVVWLGPAPLLGGGQVRRQADGADTHLEVILHIRPTDCHPPSSIGNFLHQQ